jgi:hypothetical protein
MLSEKMKFSTNLLFVKSCSIAGFQSNYAMETPALTLSQPQAYVIVQNFA